MKVKPTNPRTLYLGQTIFDSEILEVKTSIKQSLTYGVLNINTSILIPRGISLLFQSIFYPFFFLMQKNC